MELVQKKDSSVVFLAETLIDDARLEFRIVLILITGG